MEDHHQFLVIKNLLFMESLHRFKVKDVSEDAHTRDWISSTFESCMLVMKTLMLQMINSLLAEVSSTSVTL